MANAAVDRKYLLGVFGDEHDVLDATKETRASGYEIHDVYTPYAVHGLPEAMGLRPSKLTWVCFFFAAIGFAVAVAAQFWIAGVDWPVNVGGRPFNSLPAYLPVMFECIVLFGGLGVLFVLFVKARLYPGKADPQIHPDISNHRFVLAVEQMNSSFDRDSVSRIWEGHNVVEVRQTEGLS